MPLPKIGEIVAGSDYLPPARFYEHFPSAFDAVRGQILKFEREQAYREPGKPYDEAIVAGDFEAALKYIPYIVESNQPGYDLLKSKHVEFIRCRPIKTPISAYLKWEIEVYRATSNAFEDIYWCHYDQLDTVFSEYAIHDFMVFDSRMALVQDYDEEGLFRGGWYVDDIEKLCQLISLFGFIKANSVSLALLQSETLVSG